LNHSTTVLHIIAQFFVIFFQSNCQEYLFFKNVCSSCSDFQKLYGYVGISFAHIRQQALKIFFKIFKATIFVFNPFFLKTTVFPTKILLNTVFHPPSASQQIES